MFLLKKSQGISSGLVLDSSIFLNMDNRIIDTGRLVLSLLFVKILAMKFLQTTKRGVTC